MTSPAAISLLSRVHQIALPGYGDDEVVFVADTIAALRPTHIYEWGTNVGSSARLFAEAAPRALVTTVEHPDPSTHDHPGSRYGLWCEGFPRIEMLTGDGVTVALERFEAHGRPERALFFLDGDHSYEAVTRELNAVAFAAPNAVIVVHDVQHPVEAVEEAVDDFLNAPRTDPWPRIRYEAKFLYSQAGIVSLWPRPR